MCQITVMLVMSNASNVQYYSVYPGVFIHLISIVRSVTRIDRRSPSEWNQSLLANDEHHA